MKKGMLRTEIMRDCPEEFSDSLACWIDDLEISIGDVLNTLEIKGIEDLSSINDAKDALEGIHDGLY